MNDEDDYFNAAHGHLEQLEEDRRKKEEEEAARKLAITQLSLRNTVRHIQLTKATNADDNIDPTLPKQAQEIFLIGTAHVSEESAKEAYEIIELLQPETVVLELCQMRQSMLTLPDDVSEWLAAPMPSLVDVFLKTPPERRFGSILGFLMSYMYREVGQSLGIVPGAEFRAARRAAIKAGSIIVLGDRPVHVTLYRSWYYLSLYQKLKLVLMLIAATIKFSISKEDVEQMKDMNQLYELLLTVSDHFPSLPRTLISERDAFMAHTIKHCPGKTIAVVVGFGHLNGISDYLTNRQPVNLQELAHIPINDRSQMFMFAAVLLLIAGGLSSLFVFLCYLLISFLVSTIMSYIF